MRMNSVMSNMYSIVPIVTRPRKVCGWEERRRVIPPVAMVRVKLAYRMSTSV